MIETIDAKQGSAIMGEELREAVRACKGSGLNVIR
jgi:hypothetical protein